MAATVRSPATSVELCSLELSTQMTSGYRNYDYLSPELWYFFTIMNIILTVIFTLESIIKVIGLGPRLFGGALPIYSKKGTSLANKCKNYALPISMEVPL